MKLVKAEYYSMGDVIRTFHRIEESGIFKDVYLQNQTYSFNSWIRRVFYTDHALEPKPRIPGYNEKEYLHSIFEFVKPDNDPLSTANFKFIYDNVARYWLSAVFGFFKHEGMIVQVNPAYLYALSFFRAKGIPKEFNEVVREARLIPVNDTSKNWVYNMFSYYIRSIAGYSEDAICQVIADYRDHPILKMFDQLQWSLRPGLNLSEVNQCLYPLGHVVNFGVSYKLQRQLENFSPKYGRIPTLKDIQDEYLEKHKINVHSLGGWYSIDEYQVSVEDSVRSSQMHEYAKYLTYLSKAKDVDRRTEAFKEELVKRKIYSPAIMNRKSFMKDNAIPDAKQLGFNILNERGSYMVEGQRKKCYMVTVTKLKSYLPSKTK